MPRRPRGGQSLSKTFKRQAFRTECRSIRRYCRRRCRLRNVSPNVWRWTEQEFVVRDDSCPSDAVEVHADLAGPNTDLEHTLSVFRMPNSNRLGVTHHLPWSEF